MPFCSGHRFPVLCVNKLITSFRKDFNFSEFYLDEHCLCKIYRGFFVGFFFSSATVLEVLTDKNRTESGRIQGGNLLKFPNV